MGYAKIDDHLTFNPKVLAAGNEAMGAWVRLLAWCSAHRTDGKIPGGIVLTVAGSKAIVSKLVSTGMLDQSGEDFQIHDYLDWNMSRAEWEEKQQLAKQRKDRWKRERESRENWNAPGTQDGTRSSTRSEQDQERVQNSSGTLYRSGLVLSVSDLSRIWTELVGVIAHNGLLELARLLEQVAEASGQEPIAVARQYVGEFKPWVESCPPDRRPQLSPAKLVANFERIQQRVKGKSKPATESASQRLARLAREQEERERAEAAGGVA